MLVLAVVIEEDLCRVVLRLLMFIVVIVMIFLLLLAIISLLLIFLLGRIGVICRRRWSGILGSVVGGTLP